MKKILFSILLFSFSSCINSDRMSRVYFIEKIFETPDKIHSLIDSSEYNCWVYINPLYIEEFSNKSYFYNSDYMYNRYSKQKFVDGEWIYPDKYIPMHDIVIKNNSKKTKYFTFHFEYEDNKWCLKRIDPYKVERYLPDYER